MKTKIKKFIKNFSIVKVKFDICSGTTTFKYSFLKIYFLGIPVYYYHWEDIDFPV